MRSSGPARAIISAAFGLLAYGAAAADVSVIDGDTFRLGSETVRIENIDAPELRCRCPEECRLATVARDRLAELLTAEPRLDRTGRDRFGRTLARVWVDGRDIGEALVREGLARRWEGRRRRWC